MCVIIRVDDDLDIHTFLQMEKLERKETARRTRMISRGMTNPSIVSILISL